MTTPHLLDVEFESPPAELCLCPETVHLWRVWVAGVPEELTRALAPEERSRASRFHFDRDRIRFTAAHSALRHILARYVKTEAHALRFSTGTYGKPALLGATVTFNMSHSGDLVLLVVGNGCEVGIDVEQMRDNLEFDMLLDQYFPAEDARRIRLLAPPERHVAFFQLWTRTEACLKAAGVGLAEKLEVNDLRRWTVRSFTPAPGYAAAVAVQGNAFEPTCWTWPN